MKFTHFFGALCPILPLKGNTIGYDHGSWSEGH